MLKKTTKRRFLFDERWQIFSEIRFEKYYKRLRLKTFAQNIKAVPPVSPLLILNKLDIEEFCELSNEFTNFLSENCHINFLIDKNYYTDFEIDVKNIELTDYYFWFYRRRRRIKFFPRSFIFFRFFLLFMYASKGFALDEGYPFFSRCFFGSLHSIRFKQMINWFFGFFISFLIYYDFSIRLHNYFYFFLTKQFKLSYFFFFLMRWRWLCNKKCRC